MANRPLTEDTPLTKKQEAFAQKVVEIGNASEAYRQIYSTDTKRAQTVWTDACELAKHPNVSRRIEELKKLQSKNFVITKEYIARQYDELGHKCKEEGKHKDASEIFKKLEGLYDLSEESQNNRLIPDDKQDQLWENFKRRAREEDKLSSE